MNSSKIDSQHSQAQPQNNRQAQTTLPHRKHSQDQWYTHIYEEDDFPCLVKNGPTIEDLRSVPNEQEKFNRIARNGLRHLTYGVPLRETGLLTWGTFKLLMLNDERLFTALREEIQNIFNNVYNHALKYHSLDAEKRIQIFIENLLSAYPFLQPKQNEKVLLPQKINGQWQQVSYHFERIDISPQKGLLAKLIEDEDRLYALGLVPDHPAADPFLILEGTSAPWEKSKDINWLYNFKPNTSVGEGHDDTHIEPWLRAHPGSVLTGHSKGGTLAIIWGRKYAKFVKRVDALNSTGFRNETFERLDPFWTQIPKEARPQTNPFTQDGDVVFLIENKIEKKYLNEMHFYKIGKKSAVPGSRFAAHIHYFTGNKDIYIKPMHPSNPEFTSRGREFFTDIKNTLSWVMFPLLYTQLVLKLCARKVNRFFNQHSKALSIGCFFLTMAVCIGLALSGVLAPLIFPILQACGSALGYTVLAALLLGVSSCYGFLVPKLTSLVAEISIETSFLAGAITALIATMSVQAILSGLKIGLKSLLHCYPQDENIEMSSINEENNPQSTAKMTQVLRRTHSEIKLSPLAEKDKCLRRVQSEPNLHSLGFTNFEQKKQQDNGQDQTSPSPEHKNVALRLK